MIIVIRDINRSRVRVHVNHLDPEVLLYLRPKPVYPDRRFSTWVYSLPVFLNLKEPNTVLVHGNEIDRG